MKRPHFRREDLGIASVTQPGTSFISNPAGHRTEEATGAATLPSPALSPLGELTFPPRAQRSPSILDSTDRDSRQLLSPGGAELAGEGRQDSLRTKA